jgi:hypothetical protein
MLFQVFGNNTNLAGGRITLSTACPFVGRYRVKFLGYQITSTDALTLWRFDSLQIRSPIVSSTFTLPNQPQFLVVYNNDLFAFDDVYMNGMINFDIYRLDGGNITNLSGILLNFDFEKIEDDFNKIK